LQHLFSSAPSGLAATNRTLPAIVGKRLVGVCHLVSVVFLLHGVAAQLRSVDELGGQALAHGFFTAASRVADQPAHAERHASLGTNLDRNLIGGSTDTPALDLELGLHVVERLAEHLERLL